MLKFIRVGDVVWWVWLATAAMLLAGLLPLNLTWTLSASGWFICAIVLTLIQTVYYFTVEKSARPLSVQLRLAVLLFLLLAYIPQLRWLYWVPAVGLLALNFFGYCLMVRLLSLMPWNRSEPVTLGEISRVLFTAPSLDTTIQGKPAAGCAGGVCTLEVQIGRSAKVTDGAS